MREIYEILSTLEPDAAARLAARHPSGEELEPLEQAVRDMEGALARDDLDGCIGCGCLSLPSCALYNPEDRAAKAGPGPRYLMGDKPS